MSSENNSRTNHRDGHYPLRKGTSKGKLLIAFLLGIAFAVGATVLAGHRLMHGRLSDAVDYISYQYDLSGEQREHLDDVADMFREMRSLRVGLRDELRDEVRAVLDAPVVDQQRLITLISDKTQQIESNAPRLVAAAAGFVDSLYPDQKSRLLEKLERRLEGRRWHRH